MRNQLSVLSSLRYSLLNHSSKLLGLSLTIGMAVGSLAPIANAADSAAKPQTQPSTSAEKAPAAATLPDGVYLYGQSSKPEQVGQGYFVFEVNRGSVVGALYMPRSSFDCASGAFQADQLALQVVNSYDRTTNPFEIAVEKTSNVATANNPALKSIGLQGFHQLTQVSENDRRILGVCKTDLQKQAKSQ